VIEYNPCNPSIWEKEERRGGERRGKEKEKGNKERKERNKFRRRDRV
jgi:hypothetical protein